MATIKSYTDISQSKTLSKILPLESADIYYTPPLIKGHTNYFPHLKGRFPIDWDIEQAIPCWSLAALLNVLLDYHLSSPNPLSSMYCCRVNDIETYANNQVDACYEMVLKLHELKML